MTVGLYGGSFNPAHAGHFHVAKTALKRPGLDRVIWLVSPRNPLKAAGAEDTPNLAVGKRPMLGNDRPAHDRQRCGGAPVRLRAALHGRHSALVQGAVFRVSTSSGSWARTAWPQFHRWKGWALADARDSHRRRIAPRRSRRRAVRARRPAVRGRAPIRQRPRGGWPVRQASGLDLPDRAPSGDVVHRSAQFG